MRFKLLFFLLIIIFNLSLPTFAQEVRLVYFFPNDRDVPNTNIVDEQLHTLIQRVQTLFKAQVGKTFEFEKYENGKAKVHYFPGMKNYNSYRQGTELNAEKIRDEISNSGGDLAREMSNYLYLIVADLTAPGVNLSGNLTCGRANYLVEPSWWRFWEEPIDSPWAIVDVSSGCFGKPIEVQNVSSDEWKLRVWITAHELGHAFGLQHDFFRPLSHTYVMSYGKDPHPDGKFSVPTQLSPCTKEWLKVSWFFNSKTRPSDQETEIFLDKVFYSPESKNLRLEFTATDADGLHEAQLFFSDDIFLASCASLNNGLLHIGKFDISGLPEKHYNEFRDEVRIQVIDSYGYITRKEFSLPRKPQEFPKTASDLVLEFPTVQSNTSDQHVEAELTQDARLRATLKEHTDFVSSVAFSPDGKKLVSGSWDESIILWDLSTDERIETGFHENAVTSVTFSPDGQRIASAGADKVIRLWTSDATFLASTIEDDIFGKYTGVVFIKPFNSDIYRVAAANDLDENIYYFDYYDDSSRWNATWSKIGTHATSSLAVSPDQSMLASAGTKRDSNVLLWDPYNNTPPKILEGHTQPVTSIAFSPDRKILASGSEDNTVILWNIADGTRAATLEEHTNRVLSVAFSPDGKTLASGSDDETVRLWDVATGRQIDTLLGHTNGVASLAFNPNPLTYMLASAGGYDRTVLLWDLSPPPIPAPTIEITPSQVESPAVGENLIVNLKISNVENVAGYQLTVQFNPKILKFVKSENGSFFPDGDSADRNSDQIKLAAVNVSGNSTGDGTLATLTFKVIDVEPSQITLSNIIVMEQDLTTIPIVAKRCDIVLISEVKLDVNGDEVVNIEDLKFVAAHFGKVGQNKADVNVDNVVDIRDLLLVAGGINSDAAAPSIAQLTFTDLTVQEIQTWLSQTFQLDLNDANYQRGIAVLQQLLVALTPKETALLPNYPNPFNPETWIPYQLAEPADVSISIYAIDGKLVRTLNLGHQSTGIYQDKSRAAYWDGRNTIGEPVASGVYFYTFKAGEFTATRKMLIRK